MINVGQKTPKDTIEQVADLLERTPDIVYRLKVIFDIERPAKNDRVLMLELDQGLMLEVFIMENPPKHLDAPEAAGLRHLAFGVESVPEAIKWLNSRGIETGPILMDTNNNINKPVVFFWDPDGTPLELHE